MRRNTKCLLIVAAVWVIIVYRFCRRRSFTPFVSDPLQGEVPTTYNVFNRFFDKVVCVTLPERKERIQNIFNSWGLDVEIHDAYLKKDIDRAALVKEGFLDPNCSLNDGRICCHYSHTQVYRKFMNDPQLKTILILEDDLDEGPQNVEEFNRMVLPFLFNLPKDWDYVNFGPCHEQCAYNILNNKYFQKSNTPKCRQAVAFNKKAMSEIVTNTIPMTNKPGDVLIAELIQDNKFNAYSSTNILFRQKREVLGTNLGNHGTARQCKLV